MTSTVSATLPALYLSHGAPPLLDDALWTSELRSVASSLARPTAILIVSAHWESAPLMLTGAEPTQLYYDFAGFERRFYEITYASPPAHELARKVEALLRGHEQIAYAPKRGLDHGAFIPLSVMYPDADIPVLQMSLPTLKPEALLELGARLKPLRDEGVLVVGSGFTTHGLPFIRDFSPKATPPTWSREFDLWAAEAMSRGDVDELANFASRAPGMPYAHPTTEHFAPLFVTLGAATDPADAPKQVIDGYWVGLAKRSIQVT